MNEEEHEGGQRHETTKRTGETTKKTGQTTKRTGEMPRRTGQTMRRRKGETKEHQVEPPVALLISLMYLGTTPREGFSLRIIYIS